MLILHTIENLFPELAEINDEKIRKWIIGVLATYEHDKNLRDAAVAWLEKQGEHKPQRMVSAEAKEALYDKPVWSEEDEKILGILIEGFEDYSEPDAEWWKGLKVNECTKWLKSLKDKLQGYKVRCTTYLPHTLAWHYPHLRLLH